QSDEWTMLREAGAALGRFLEKVRGPDGAVGYDERESEWLAVLERTYEKYRRLIDRRQSFELGCGAILICLAEGGGSLERACGRAHRDVLKRSRLWDRNVSLDGGGAPDVAAPEEGEDEAVMGALNGLSREDEALLRERHMSNSRRSVTE